MSATTILLDLVAFKAFVGDGPTVANIDHLSRDVRACVLYRGCGLQEGLRLGRVGFMRRLLAAPGEAGLPFVYAQYRFMLGVESGG